MRVSIEPDTKDWTWVIDEPCLQCGFDPTDVERTDLPELIHENTRGWYVALADADYAVRPAPHVWSRLEYACHVRDVHELFARRVRLMLDEHDPTFDNWDQDATAEEQEYGLQDPGQVGTDLVERAAEVAATYASVEDDQWGRTGRRSNGSVFTVQTMGIYHLHDVAHHLWDVTRSPEPSAVPPGDL
jgi:DinB superfamily